MRVLGLSFSGHGSSICLVEDGRIVRATNLERITGHKHALVALPGYVDFLRDVNVRMYRSGPQRYFDFYEVFPAMLEHVTGSPRLGDAGLDLVVKTRDNIAPLADLRPNPWAEEYVRFLETFRPIPTYFELEHHLAHAYQAYLCSPFEDTAILTADGSGEALPRLNGQSVSTTFAIGRSRRVNVIEEICFPHTVGGLYSSFTRHLGFRENQEGNTMALAAFGSDAFHRRVADWVTLRDDGRYELAFGPSLTTLRILDELAAYVPVRGESDEITQQHMDAAWAVQRIAEDVLVNAARGLHARTGLERLTIAGGVGLNCVANARILKETPFESAYIMPNAGDCGLAAGSALFGYHVLLRGQEHHPPEHDYLGRIYSDDEIRSALASKSGIAHRHSDDVAAEAAALLATGSIIGWFQGGAEFGPRALGHRSILADPRTDRSKKRLDDEIKQREWFRPYAPSVLAERADELFSMCGPSPYMLMAFHVRPEQAARIPGVVHVDGTARIQTVARAQEPLYHRLISEFAQHTGVPLILNTSFNRNGAPIVETPADAIEALRSMNLDALAIGNYLAWRTDARTVRAR